MNPMKKKIIDKSNRPPLKCKADFSTDEFLMFLIQDVTKLPAADILGFFADLGKIVAEEGVHAMFENGTTSMNKKIFDYFPNSAIPYSLKVDGNRDYYWASHADACDSSRKAYYHISVGFPEKHLYVDQSKLIDILIEKELLGGATIPDFKKPDTKCPKMYKDLMKKISK